MLFPGETRFHLFSGRRWNVVSVDRTDATSFWEVKRERANSSIIYLKNNSTERYLGMLDNFLFSNWLEMQCSRFLCGILTFVRHFLYILTGLDGTYAEQTFVYNSVLLTGMEFTCTLRHFLCP